MNDSLYFNGIPVITSIFITKEVLVQYRFPRINKKRMVKKFKKLYSRINYVPDVEKFMIIEPNFLTKTKTIMCHPLALKKLKEASKINEIQKNDAVKVNRMVVSSHRYCFRILPYTNTYNWYY